MIVRPPAVAGSFYPADPRALSREIAAYLALAEASADPASPRSVPRALIVPHAGYVYSGPIAARAYSELEGLRGRIRRVVLLGPAHRVPVRGLAMLPADAMRTPLGLVPIDHGAEALLRDLPQVSSNEIAHAAEHSLEVQLPFLQTLLGEFSVVPLVVGDASDAEVSQVIERLWHGLEGHGLEGHGLEGHGVEGPETETLFVVSSDLSHYLDDASARRMDAATCAAIERLDERSLDDDSACGRIPLRGLLRVAREHGLEIETLDLRNSSDTAGSPDSVVGYGAWVLRERRGARNDEAQTGDGERATASASSDASDARLLSIARRSIEHGLATGRAMPLSMQDMPKALREPGAAFVSLHDARGQLRGCIGTLEAYRPLAEDVAENAWAAASRDPRFPPLSASELSGVTLHVSRLTTPVPIAARSRAELVQRLRPGRDGLVLEDRGRRATFVPDVWQGLPDAEEFVAQLWKKAGLPPDHWSPTARAWRYEARSVGEQAAAAAAPAAAPR